MLEFVLHFVHGGHAAGLEQMICKLSSLHGRLHVVPHKLHCCHISTAAASAAPVSPRQDGKLLAKNHTFDDVAAAAEFLIKVRTVGRHCLHCAG